MVESLRQEHGVEGLMFKLADDPRVTRVGRLLRKYSLDESRSCSTSSRVR